MYAGGRKIISEHLADQPQSRSNQKGRQMATANPSPSQLSRPIRKALLSSSVLATFKAASKRRWQTGPLLLRTQCHVRLQPHLQLIYRAERTNVCHVTVWSHQDEARLGETIAGMKLSFLVNVVRA